MMKARFIVGSDGFEDLLQFFETVFDRFVPSFHVFTRISVQIHVSESVYLL